MMYPKLTIYRQQLTAFLILLSLLFISACSRSAAQAPTPAPAGAQTESAYEGIIVAFGNSLTEGMGVEEAQTYPAQLERKLQDAGYLYRVINAGVSGETSSGALSRVDWVLSTLKPNIVVLETGGNDGLRGIDPQVTAKNINQIVEKIKASNSLVILAGMETAQNMGQEYTTTFEAIYPAAATDQDLILIPFFLEGVAGDPTLNQEDGIHPTAEGYKIVVETVYPYVVQAIEKRSAP